MEKRALLAIIVSLGIFLVLYCFLEKFRKPSEPASPAPPAASRSIQPPAGPGQGSAALPTPRRASPSEVLVDTPLFLAVFTNTGGGLKSLRLKHYSADIPKVPVYHLSFWPVSFRLDRRTPGLPPGSSCKELICLEKDQRLPLSVHWEGNRQNVPPTVTCAASVSSVVLKGDDAGEISFTSVTPPGLTIVRTYRFKADSYRLDLTVRVENKGREPAAGRLGLGLAQAYDTCGGENRAAGFYGSINGRPERVRPGDLLENKEYSGKVQWVSLDEGYFLSAAIPGANFDTVTLKAGQHGAMTATLVSREASFLPNQEASYRLALYLGPKEDQPLKAMGLTVDMGWFSFLGRPLVALLHAVERFTGNYGWAIILVTLLFRVVLFYPNHLGFKSSMKMQQLRPAIAQIREHYQHDRQVLNQAMMNLYRTYKVNPLGGCLPLLLSIPIFFALDNALEYTTQLRQSSFIATLPGTDIIWLADLSIRDPLLIMPLAYLGTMILMSRMNPIGGSDTWKVLSTWVFPLIVTGFFLNFAAGLILYWLANNVFSMGETWCQKKLLLRSGKLPP